MKKIVWIGWGCLLCATSSAQVRQDSLEQRQLGEAVVKGEKPVVKGQNGMMVVDLPALVKDKPVSNVLEALAYLPGVTSENGQVGLAGASGVTIILNGELTNMPISKLYQLLYAMPTDRLKQVEVMYAAPAKYHVNGAVINIVLKTPSPLDGLQGQARAGYNQGHYGSYGTTLSAIYALKSWTFDANYSLSRSKGWAHESYLSNHLLGDRRTVIEQEDRRSSESLSHLLYASAGYRFSEKSRLSLTYNGEVTGDVHSSVRASGTMGNFLNDIRYDGPKHYHNAAVKYTAPFGLTLGGDYTRYGEKRTQRLTGLDGKAPAVSVSDQQVDRYHVYADQTHDIGGWNLSYGVEYQNAFDRSWQAYETGQDGGFSATRREEVVDAYVGLQHSFKWGLSFGASAKGEYFKDRYRHNWNFIPVFGATFCRDPKHLFQLNFTSQRVYPSYWELHGGTVYHNDYSMVVGNTGLRPFLNYSSQLTYVHRQKYVATLYFQYGDGASVQLPYQSPDELKLIYQTINMNFKRVAGLNLNVPFKVGGVWDATLQANVFHQREKADHFHDISFDHRKWIAYGAFRNTVKPGPKSPVSFSVDLACISSAMQGIADLSRMWRMDAGVKWNFGHKRCCELNLKADDIFNSWSPDMDIRHAGQDFHMKVSDMSRNVKLTFIWRFNGFKPKDISIDTSRFGTGK